MNIKEYISSGIVESYVLGLVSDAEKQELETMCLQYPELAEARSQYEEMLENKLMAEGVPPPPALKEKIENSLQPSANPAYADMYEEEQAPVKKMFNWRWVAAASVILLLGSLAWAFMLNDQKKDLLSRNEELKQQLTASLGGSEEYNEMTGALRRPGLKVASMHGQGASAAFATVYWDTTNRDVYLMINHMPAPATDKQYQLWALIDNKPVDLGVFEMRQEKLLVKMKNVHAAQAFAITLEPKGGSPAPTMESMQVYGKL